MKRPLDKARLLYRNAYSRWALELSHDKNVIIAKDICEYICNQVLGDMGADRGYEFWTSVRGILKIATHEELMKEEERAIVKFNGGLGALLCSKCRVIMRTIKDFSEEELKYIKGDLDYLPPQYCEQCKQKENEESSLS